ncbi:MAG: hypothetical protein HOE45_10410 [Gammaproteobacteria bacterium]|nr:hypothetical protein [Gammaproteobacteria bacterium]
MLVIERAIFSQTDKDVWQLALVGDKEFITQDLCGSSYGCDYSADNFQKLVEGNSYFDRVDDNTKKLIIQSNEYFGGSNVVVYDQSNLELEPDLNSLDPILGNHEQTLVKKDTIEALRNNNPPYGDLFWQPSYASVLETFSTDSACVNAYNSNTSACLSADNNVSCLITDATANACSCFTYKNSQDQCGYVDMTQNVLVRPYRVEAKGLLGTTSPRVRSP